MFSEPSPWLIHEPPPYWGAYASMQQVKISLGQTPYMLGALQACAGSIGHNDDWPGGAGITPQMRADAARAGQLDFRANVPPDWDKNWGGTEYSYDSYIFAGDHEDDYHPEHGWGTEASRPPDYDDPDDVAAYPYGVIYEDEPEYEPEDYGDTGPYSDYSDDAAYDEQDNHDSG